MKNKPKGPRKRSFLIARKVIILPRPPLGGGSHGRAVTGGESLKFSENLYVMHIGNIFSPSVSFADSSLVRGSFGCCHARVFFDTPRTAKAVLFAVNLLSYGAEWAIITVKRGGDPVAYDRQRL